MTQSVQFYTSGTVAGVFFIKPFFHHVDKWHDKKLGFRGGQGIKKNSAQLPEEVSRHYSLASGDGLGRH